MKNHWLEFLEEKAELQRELIDLAAQMIALNKLRLETRQMIDELMQVITDAELTAFLSTKNSQEQA